MILTDVNVLVYAFRADEQRHAACSSWLRTLLAGPEHLALHDLVLAGMLRVSTSRRIYANPAPPDVALAFLERLVQHRRARWVTGAPTWPVLRRLVDGDDGIAGNLVPDAVLAAAALAHGCRLATTDRGFARYPGLQFFDPVSRPDGSRQGRR